MGFSLPVWDNSSEPSLDVSKPSYAFSLAESYEHRTVFEPGWRYSASNLICFQPIKLETQ